MSVYIPIAETSQYAASVPLKLKFRSKIVPYRPPPIFIIERKGCPLWIHRARADYVPNAMGGKTYKISAKWRKNERFICAV
jgi:hypothetical protein